jgi:transposase-like protein
MKKVTTMKRKPSTEEKRAAIAVRLRRGDISAIATKTGYDKSHVGRVLRGTSTNPSNEIVNAAYTMVSRRKVSA